MKYVGLWSGLVLFAATWIIALWAAWHIYSLLWDILAALAGGLAK